jgi:3-deoxy-D-manno-octulosonic-acid transferase
MGVTEPQVAVDPSRLTPLERAYSLLAPIAFGGAQNWERLTGASRAELRARRGFVTPIDGPTLWFHGASAGEMAAAVALDAMLHQRGFAFRSVYTAANRAGVEYIERTAPPRAVATLVPWDLGATLARAFARWRPRMIFLVETELWPRLIYEAYVRAIPIFCVSARIYPRDLKRYRAIRRFFAPTLRRITRIIAQDDLEQHRFEEIGAPSASCLTGGNLKYLRPNPAPASRGLATELGIDGQPPIIVVGSLHLDEADEVLATLRRLEIPDLRIIIAPRHLAAVEPLEAAARRLGWVVRRRSQPVDTSWRVLIVDSIGELKGFHSFAWCAIVGGGFAQHGGHNPFEPILAGAPAVFGPHFENFAQESRVLVRATPEAQVGAVTELERLLTRWICDDARRRDVLARQRAVVPDAEAIAGRYLEALAPWLSLIRA